VATASNPCAIAADAAAIMGAVTCGYPMLAQRRFLVFGKV
jgi:hypothetical protein